jgi:hypothetical protein
LSSLAARARLLAFLASGASGVAVLVGVSVVPRSAYAQSRADKAAAQRLLTQGNQAVGEGDYLTALDRFKRAYDRFPSPKVLVNIGSTERLLGRYAEAAATYEAFLADPAADKGRFPEVQRALREIDALVARVRINVADKQAIVRLDGKEIPKLTSGDVLRIDPGEHTVVAVREGFPPAVSTLKLRPGDETIVTLEIKPPERVVVRTAGPQRTFGFVVGGLGVAGVVAGLGLGGGALSAKSSAASHCFGSTTECDAQGVSDLLRARALGNASTGAFIGGLALVATGVTLVLTAPATTMTRTRDEVALSLRIDADGSTHLHGAW